MAAAQEYQKHVATLIKVDDALGLVFGWGLVCKVDGEDYYDVQGDNITEPGMVEATTDFMLNARVAKEMHKGDQIGAIVHSFPLTTEIAAAMDIVTKRTGWMVAMKPDSDETLEKFRNGSLTGFSIGGWHIEDEAA